MWADVVLARAGLEACARAGWLAQSGITTEQRVGRFRNLRLLSPAEQAQLAGAPAADVQAAQAKTAALLGGPRRSASHG